MASSEPAPPAGVDYAAALAEAKALVQSARTRAVLAANTELIVLYWELGQLIGERQASSGWGSKVIERFSADLRAAFPEMTGLSCRCATCVTCGRWPRLGRRRQLCNESLQDCPGATTSSCSTSSTTRPPGNGTPVKRSITAGHEQCWPTRSCPSSMFEPAPRRRRRGGGGPDTCPPGRRPWNARRASPNGGSIFKGGGAVLTPPVGILAQRGRSACQRCWRSGPRCRGWKPDGARRTTPTRPR
jgi:DUF1016 N-terminal domain